MNFDNLLAGIVAEKNAQETGTKPIDMALIKKIFSEHYFEAQRFGLVRLVEKLNQEPQPVEAWLAVMFLGATQFAWNNIETAWEDANTSCLDVLYND